MIFRKLATNHLEQTTSFFDAVDIVRKYHKIALQKGTTGQLNPLRMFRRCNLILTLPSENKLEEAHPPIDENPMKENLWEIAKHIVETYRKNQNITTKYPSFKEFIDYLLSEGYLGDTHWRPLYFRGFICFIKYSFLGQMETFNEDMNFLIKRATLKAENKHI